MSCFLPPEILDHIVDHLPNEPTALKKCCLVPKSWIPRTRKYLFAHVEFRAERSHFELWKKTFPDPSNSPAHQTRSLLIHGFAAVAVADAEGWIRTFNRIVHLRLVCHNEVDHQATLIPSHKLSPAIRSLHLDCTYPKVLDLICSFPLLEDLAFDPLTHWDDVDG